MDQTTTPTPLEEPSNEAVTPDGFVTISREELESLRTRAELAGYAERNLAPTRSRPVAGVEDPGEGVDRDREAMHAEEIGVRDRKLAELEQAYRSAVRDREVATVLAGKPLASGAAAQLIKLWRDDLDVYEEDGALKVSARDGRPVARAVNDWLASPEFSHFCLPPSRGGAGSRDANRPASAPSAKGEPRTLGEAIVLRWRDEVDSRPASMLSPVGLKRRR